MVKIECKTCGDDNPNNFSLDHNRSKCNTCKYLAKKKNVPRTLYENAKRRATKKGLDFDIEVSDITVPDKCPILGIELKTKPYQQGGNTQWDHSPTLDRVDSSKGYTKSNILVVSEKANRLKSEGTAEEHILIAAYMVRHAKKI